MSADREIVIVGAGFSGIGAGIRCKRSGLDDFLIVDAADDVGGTWRDNTYPGVAVDIASSVYSYSFELNPHWSRAYAPGAELKSYADHCVAKYGLAEHLRLRTHVERARFDEERSLWQLTLVDRDAGTRSELTARFLLGATGSFATPRMPDIPGVGAFQGVTMHTAAWDHDVDLRGRRVAVIGTGATAVQVVPAIAPQVRRLTVFQRTPIWIFPKPDRAISEREQRIYRRFPVTQRLMRALQFTVTEVVMVLCRQYYTRAPWVNHALERLMLRNLERQVPDPSLRAKLRPAYGFWCKRPTYSNEYWPVFNRDNVDLVTDPIDRITPTGVVTADGIAHEVDVLVLATGFRVFQPDSVPGFTVIGRDGVDLGEYWRTQRYQAYLGAAVPKFPNLFLMVGPYAFTGGSWFQQVENQSRHAVRAIAAARRRGADRVEVRQAAHDRYFAQVQRRQRTSVFYNRNCGTANSYFFDHHGDAPFLRPAPAVEAWWNSRTYPLDAYDFHTS
ncbi:MAG: NAD(P)/FAD-dependent oxidoreductase [Mycobacteriaceae bacterium]|nr:NAD(P)/FAD-dependent oxidoreductase [Mycobacteriaceae bacterium]